MKVGIVWENGVARWVSQMFEPLMEYPGVDVDVFVGERNKFDVKGVRLNKKFLTHREEVLLGLTDLRGYLRNLGNGPRYKRLDFYRNSLNKYLDGYDVVECTDSSRSLYTLAGLKGKHGFRLVVSYAENIPFRQAFDEKTDYIKKTTYDKIDHFIPWCDTIRDTLLLEGVPEERMTTVYAGVDLKLFKPGPKDEGLMREYGVGPDGFTVLYVGKLVSWKGVHLLPYAALALRKRGYKDFRVLITGRGAQLENLKRVIAAAGVQAHFTFTGFMPYEEMGRLYSLADVFVLPSYPTMTWQEQFGMVLVEAMACGKPVVGSESGSIPEVVGDGGLLFTPGNFHELADRLATLMDDRALLKELGGRALERARTHFDARKNAEKIYGVYKRVLKG